MMPNLPNHLVHFTANSSTLEIHQPILVNSSELVHNEFMIIWKWPADGLAILLDKKEVIYYNVPRTQVKSSQEYFSKLIQIFLIKRLPPPFEAKCRDFLAEGLISISYCKYFCISQFLGEFLPGYPVSRVNFTEKLHLNARSDNFSSCYHYCRGNPCDETYFEISQGSKLDIVSRYRNSSSLIFELKFGFANPILYKQIARFTFITYLIDIGSILSFVFGFSLIGYGHQMTKLTQYSIMNLIKIQKQHLPKWIRK